MAERCQHLDYRREGDGKAFEVARAYCTVADRFVQPVTADICNARYDLDPTEHCEIYLDHHGVDGEESAGGTSDSDSVGDGEDGRKGSDP
ncbi:hypothetical protein ACFO0N_14670 [Halobium salinum]|uniref:Uncharacterized protein n=1 Tax=Halobium salinum TaxID=1364940 RepID=A0ABD5PEJ7_9EURY|nr:hypothetical protein [Halobium salinum]